MTQGVLNVVPEYIEEQAVSQKMKPPPVHEHGCEKRDDRNVKMLRRLEEAKDGPLRNDPESSYKLVHPRTQRELKEKDKDVNPDEGITYKRESP